MFLNFEKYLKNFKFTTMNIITLPFLFEFILNENKDKVVKGTRFCNLNCDDSSSSSSYSADCLDLKCSDFNCDLPVKKRRKAEIVLKKRKRNAKSSSSTDSSSVDCNELYTTISFISRDTISRVNSEISSEFSNLLRVINDILEKGGVDLRTSILGCLNSLEKSMLILFQNSVIHANESIVAASKTASSLLNKTQGAFLSKVEANIYNYIQKLLAIILPADLFTAVHDANAGLLVTMTQYLTQINNGLVPITNTIFENTSSALVAANEEERKELINKLESAFDSCLLCISDAISSALKGMDESIRSLIALQLVETRRAITKILIRGNKEIILSLSVLLRNICRNSCIINPNSMLLI
ncbi:hypothetical protein TUBRATIS_11780 [Tubulinosema ratisbonensis]|uniref:Uncharacterized protein n=1 Tax=Tubulinosema ratisbonensis TaxID=291195 RepID=A0A437AMC3_9MICR|nr:hypothetical protein TUBRATIS_11780 [Tubulinosema ratisbonensis]